MLDGSAEMSFRAVAAWNVFRYKRYLGRQTNHAHANPMPFTNRLLADASDVVAAWHERSTPPTPSEAAT